MRLNFERAIEELSLLTVLHEFDPCVIGTPPLGIAIKTSDIDIACSADDLTHFQNVATAKFGEFDCFQYRSSTVQNQKSIIVQFHACDWDIELFCQSVPTDRQWGVRHFNVEQRLVNIEPNLISVVLQLKQLGLKTEPAFARALKLTGDPYRAILELENRHDDELRQLLASRL